MLNHMLHTIIMVCLDGHDERLWLYFKFPEDVQVEWTKTYRESADNQSFLTNIFDSLGKSIFNDSESTKKDQRIRFHIAMVRELSDKISKYEGITPAHADFLNRMGGFAHPIWHSYFGVELLVGDINSDVYGVTNKVRNYLDVIMNNTDVDYKRYKESIELVTSVCLENGMRALDYGADHEDFERLTAWYGQSDSYYNMEREMTSTPMYLPEHGKSIFVGGQEMSFSAVRPREARDMFIRDPFDASEVRFGTAILRPSLNTIHVNIRGEIRSSETAKNIFEERLSRNTYTRDAKAAEGANLTPSEKRRLVEEGDHANTAALAAYKFQSAWLDNVEIVLANIVDGRQSSISEALQPYGLEAVNITKRQHLALCSTVPCYPNPIFKVPAGNIKRNPNVNNFYSGVLSLSGLFRSTKPAASGGILLGLSESGYEYKEIFTEVDASKKYGSSPTILVTGATGSGKALTLDNKIETPNGLVELRDLKVGDKVLGADGKPTEIVFITEEQHNRELFEITLNNGATIKADANHQWVVTDILLESLTEKEKKDFIQFNEKMLNDLLDNSIHNTIRIEALAELFSHTGGKLLGWDKTSVLESSLNFVEVYPQSDGNYNIAQVVGGLKTRIQQRLNSSISWKDNVKVSRINTSELYHSGTTHNGEPRFIIPTINSIKEENNYNGNDPYLIGLLTSASVDEANNTIRPNDLTLHYNSIEYQEQSDRIMNRLKDNGYDVFMDDYGFFRFMKEEQFNNLLNINNNKKDDISTIRYSYSARKEFISGIIDGLSYKPINKGAISIKSVEEMDNIITIFKRSGFIVENVSYHGDNNYMEVLLDDVMPSSNENIYFTIEDIKPIDSEPVKCLSVDNATKTYLIEDFIPTSNTVQMLSMIAQTVYQGKKAVFLNPKPQSSQKPFFDLLGGETINMNTKYLDENPGKLDPMFFLEDREQVGRLLADMIIKAQGMNSSSADEPDMIRSMEELTTELIERAKLPLNQCSYDIIFGNNRADPPTPRLSDDKTVSFVRTKMQSSPFWKATISRDPDGKSRLQQTLTSGRPILIEWDNSIILPQKDTNPDKYTPAEKDGIQSISNLFEYGAEIIGQGKSGGILCIDEAHILKSSETAMNKVRGAGRLWRSANITLMLATQNLADFLGDHDHNIGSYIRLFIIMRVDEADPREIDLFYDRTKLPRDAENTHYITNAGVKKANVKNKKDVPSAYIIDTTYDWQGGILCGPWPERELKAAIEDSSITDKIRQEQLANMTQNMINNEEDTINEDSIREEDYGAQSI